jgi:hypothetical protein
MAQLKASQLREVLEGNLARSIPSLDAAMMKSFPAAAVEEIERGGTPETPSIDPTRRLDRDLLTSDVVYAIPDDALALFPELAQAVIAAFGKGPAAALPALVGLMFRYRTLRVVLTADEAAVLRVLKQANVETQPPLAPADIEGALKRDGLMTQKSVAELLQSLVKKKTDKATLVRETDGRWSIGNV